MDKIPTTIEIKYYQPYFEQPYRGIVEREIEILEEEISNIGHFRTRKFNKDLGGEETNIWLIIQFVGAAAFGGIVEHIVSKKYEQILKFIQNYRNRAKNEEIEFEQAITIVFSYDDLDINITIPNETNVTVYDRIMKQIHTQLSNEPLKSKKVSQLFIPYVFDEKDELWKHTYNWNETGFKAKYWGINTHQELHRTDYVEDIYDSEENRFVKVPNDSIFENF